MAAELLFKLHLCAACCPKPCVSALFAKSAFVPLHRIACSRRVADGGTVHRLDSVSRGFARSAPLH